MSSSFVFFNPPVCLFLMLLLDPLCLLLLFAYYPAHPIPWFY